jgi:hypothetical protein
MLRRLPSHMNSRTLDRRKFKPLMFSVSGFSYSEVAKISIFVILYDLCSLLSQFSYVIINIRYLESHVQLADRCAPRKFANSVENLVLQALQFQKVGICRKFPGGASQSHITTGGQSASQSWCEAPSGAQDQICVLTGTAAVACYRS